MRDEHCAFAICYGGNRCIADCHYNWDSTFEQDCVGIPRYTDEEFIEDGKEYRLGGRFKKHGT
jgi:hypothetical protein